MTSKSDEMSFSGKLSFPFPSTVIIHYLVNKQNATDILPIQNFSTIQNTNAGKISYQFLISRKQEKIQNMFLQSSFLTQKTELTTKRSLVNNIIFPS